MKQERALANRFIYVPVPQLSSISITYSERQICVTQEMFWGLQPYKVCASEMDMQLQTTHIFHTHLEGREMALL